MQQDEKDKYEEIESLGDAEDLEELPVEAIPEPLSERTEPMDDIVNRKTPEVGQPPVAEETGSDLGKKIEEAAKVRDAAEYLRGQKKVRVIKKSAIKGIVDSIIKTYSGIEHQDLLSKIAEYEFSISNLKQDRDALKEQVELLLKERQTLQDEVAMKYEKELEDLRARMASAEKLLGQDSSKEKVAKLEEEIVRLKQRIRELEQGLEFATVVEEYDYGLAIESATEQKQKIAQLAETLDSAIEAEPDKQAPKTLKEVLTAIDERYNLLLELLKESQRSYADLFKKVDNKEGSVGVIAELVRLNARNRGWNQELDVCGEFLHSADVTVRRK
jgi:predicted  nucleic acid-binding Zn-ribbon protein